MEYCFLLYKVYINIFLAFEFHESKYDIYLGLLIFGIIEELQDNILDFSYSLGAVTFLCAILFAIDLFFFKQMSDPKNAISQTDLENAIETHNKEVYHVTNIPKVNQLEKCCHPSGAKNVKKLKYLRTDL